VKVLGFQVQREHVGQQRVERAGNFHDGIGLQVGRGVERGLAQLLGFLDVHGFRLLWL